LNDDAEYSASSQVLAHLFFSSLHLEESVRTTSPRLCRDPQCSCRTYRTYLCDLCTAKTPTRTLDNRWYKCNRAANPMTSNPMHLLRLIVPKSLMWRKFRGKQSECGGAGLACGTDQSEPTRTQHWWDSNYH